MRGETRWKATILRQAVGMMDRIDIRKMQGEILFV